MRINDAQVRVKAGPGDGLEEGTFTAYASVFGNADSWGDVVVPGAFANTLADWAAKDAVIPLLFGHRFDDPDMNLGHVADAVEDDHGLLVTGVLDLDNPKAQQVYRMLKGRRINQMSFAYDVVDSGTATHDGKKVTELRELRLHEVSVVPLGANQETEILTVKASAAALAAVKAGRVLSAKNESSLREARDAIDSVLASLDDQDAGTGKAAPAGGGTAPESKASGHTDATPQEPAKATGQEPRVNPSARALELQATLLAT